LITQGSGKLMLKEVSTTFYDAMFGEVNTNIPMSQLEKNTLHKVRDILNRPEKLSQYVPAVPAMLVRLLNKLKDPHSDVFVFVEIIEQEPSFALEVLRVANSAKYCRDDKQILSLRRGISLLGISGLSRIATHLLMAKVIPCNPIYYKMFGRQIWVHSVQCATLCELLASEHENDLFDAYFLGLIHDLGKVLIFDCLCKALNEELISLPGTKIFKELMSEMSADISHFVAQQWEIPSIYIEALAQQKVKNRSSLAELLYKADQLGEAYFMKLKGKMTDDQQDDLLAELSVDKNFWLDFIEIAPEIERTIA
jgi:HD-like signal output (HDOD) protein